MITMTDAKMDRQSLTSVLALVVEAMKVGEAYNISVARLGDAFVVDVEPAEEDKNNG